MALTYETALGLCKKYFSSDAQKFLDRQISTHLRKPPSDVRDQDKPELAKWCRTSGRLVIGEDKAAMLAQEIMAA